MLPAVPAAGGLLKSLASVPAMLASNRAAYVYISNGTSSPSLLALPAACCLVCAWSILVANCNTSNPRLTGSASCCTGEFSASNSFFAIGVLACDTCAILSTDRQRTQSTSWRNQTRKRISAESRLANASPANAAQATPSRNQRRRASPAVAAWLQAREYCHLHRVPPPLLGYYARSCPCALLEFLRAHSTLRKRWSS